MKILFFGSDDLAQEVLQDLIEHKYSIIGVVVQPEKKAGRGRKVKNSPVKLLAEQHSIEVFQPQKASSHEFVEQVKVMKPELFVVFSYGQILSKELLSTVNTAINIHPSLLPCYRGPSPIRAPLMNGDKETGVTIIEMNEEMDAGPILGQENHLIDSRIDYLELKKKLCQMSKSLIKSVLEDYKNGVLKKKEQEGNVTFTSMMGKTLSSLCKKNILIEGNHINWAADAILLVNLVRAFSDKGVSAILKYNNREIQVKIYQMDKAENENIYDEALSGDIVYAGKKGLIVKVKKDVCKIGMIQLPGKKIISANDFVNALKNQKFT